MFIDKQEPVMSDRSVAIVDTHRDLDKSGNTRVRFDAAIRDALAKQREPQPDSSPADALKRGISQGDESALRPKGASSGGVFDNLKVGAAGTRTPDALPEDLKNLGAIKDIQAIERVVKGVAPNEREGYRLAGASENAPGLHAYASVDAETSRPDIIRYTTQAGDKVIVSRELTPELFDQVTRDQEKLRLIADSEASGYRLAESSELPTRRVGFKSAESLSLGLIRYETEAGDKVIVFQDITPDLYAQMSKEVQIFNGASGALDTTLIDDSPYGARAGDWGVFTGEEGKFPTQQDIDLNRPRAAANMLFENWDNWGLGDRAIDFSNPPADLPPEARACLEYVVSSPTYAAALDAGGIGRADGVIYRGDVEKFIDHSNKDLESAAKALDTFKTNNPDATPLALETARSAALLMANSTLVGMGGPQMIGANALEAKGDLSIENLRAVQDDPGLSQTLTSAAGLWANDGMFRSLDKGGMPTATSSVDGIVQQDNIAKWLSDQAPSTDHAVLMMLSDAAVRSSVADVDTSGLSHDIFEHPENYDGKTKTAALLEITDARTRISSGDSADGSEMFNASQSQIHGINPSREKVEAELDAAATLLASDPDVQAFMAEQQKTGLTELVNNDPGLKVQLEHYQDTEINSGHIIDTSLAAKDQAGNVLDTSDALLMAATDAGLVNIALGGDGNVDLNKIADHSGKLDDIETYFRENVLSGKSLDEALAQDKELNGDKANPVGVLAGFSSTVGTYKAFLGDRFDADDESSLQTLLNEKSSETMLGEADEDMFKTIFGDASGEFDETKANEYIAKAMEEHPELFVDSEGNALNSQDLVTMIRGAWDLERQGGKLADGLPKIIDGFKSQAPESYKQGLMHAGSALLVAGVLVSNSANGSNTPGDLATRISAGTQFASLLMDAGTKYAKEAGYGKAWEPVKPGNIYQRVGKGPLTLDQIKTMGSLSTVVGGAAGMVGGIFGIIGGTAQLKAGDKAGAGLSLTSGALGVTAALASIIEGGAGLFGASAVGAWASMAAAGLGWAAAGVGMIAGIVLPIVQVAQRSDQINDLYNGLIPTLEKYDLTGGPETEGDFPAEDIYPYQSAT